MNELKTLLESVLTPIVSKAVKDAMSAEVRQPEPPQLVDVKGAAALTGYAVHSIYQLSSAGKIPSKKIGRKLMFSRADLIAWIDNGGRK